MRKIGIFFGSTTGYTEEVAEKIATRLGVGKEDIHNVMDTQVEAVAPYDILLLGCSTWGEGELQDDWNDFLFKLKDLKLEGKTVAIFGCGDSATYSTSFCDAIGLIHNELIHTGCRFAGETEVNGYSFDHSGAEINGKFAGLPIDEINEPEKTEERVNAWVEKLKKLQ